VRHKGETPRGVRRTGIPSLKSLPSTKEETMSEYLDLRDLAQQWRDLLDEDGQHAPEDADTVSDFAALCGELGIEASPDALEHQGDMYDPTMIADGYFVDYARELAEDIGAINPDASWPLSYIDWEAAADALRVDYVTVSYAGDDYLIRA
jgi:antirestriction protein